MADFSKFRTALNGFHRADVAFYIENLCAEHQKAMNQAQKDADQLKQALSEAEAALLAQEAKTQALQKQLDETETALKSTEGVLEEAMAMLDEVKETTAEEPSPDYAALELEAYRRAEAVERSSAERSLRMRQQINNLLDELSGRYEQTGTEIQALTADIHNNLLRLQEALSDLDVFFEETTQTFDSMDADALIPEAE